MSLVAGEGLGDRGTPTVGNYHPVEIPALARQFKGVGHKFAIAWGENCVDPRREYVRFAVLRMLQRLQLESSSAFTMSGYPLGKREGENVLCVPSYAGLFLQR